MNPFMNKDTTGSGQREPVDKKTGFTQSQMKRIEKMSGQKKKQGLGLSENLLDEYSRMQRDDSLMQFNSKNSNGLMNDMDLSTSNLNKQ